MMRFIEKLGAVSTIGVKIRRDVHSHGLLLFKDGKCTKEKFLDDDKTYVTIRIESVSHSGTTETIYVDTALLQNDTPHSILMNARQALIEYCIAEINNDFAEYLNSVDKKDYSEPLILGEKK